MGPRWNKSPERKRRDTGPLGDPALAWYVGWWFHAESPGFRRRLLLNSPLTTDGRIAPRTTTFGRHHIAAWPRSVRSDVIAISPNCRGGTRQSRGFCSSTLTAPA